MTAPASTPAASGLGSFLAHAQAIELTIARVYGILAESAAGTRNAELAALFHDLAYQSRRHAAEVTQRGESSGGLPALPAWELPGFEGAPVGAADVPDDLRAALLLALRYEEQALAYYSAIAVETSDPEVARLATECAAEEARHVERVGEWLVRCAGQ